MPHWMYAQCGVAKTPEPRQLRRSTNMLTEAQSITPLKEIYLNDCVTLNVLCFLLKLKHDSKF